MNTEQLRAEFEAWALAKWPGAILSPDQNNCGIVVPERYKHPKLQAAWEAYQAGRAALQSQDAERLDWIEANHGCEIIEFADGTWEVNVPVGPFGIGNGMREAIDHARRIEGEAK